MLSHVLKECTSMYCKANEYVRERCAEQMYICTVRWTNVHMHSEVMEYTHTYIVANEYTHAHYGEQVHVHIIYIHIAMNECIHNVQYKKL